MIETTEGHWQNVVSKGLHLGGDSLEQQGNQGLHYTKQYNSVQCEGRAVVQNLICGYQQQELGKLVNKGRVHSGQAVLLLLNNLKPKVQFVLSLYQSVSMLQKKQKIIGVLEKRISHIVSFREF